MAAVGGACASGEELGEDTFSSFTSFPGDAGGDGDGDPSGDDDPSGDGDPDSCGDGVVDASEACDGAALAGESCESLGFGFGTLACASDCSFETSGCATASCGNGIVETGEVCDGADLGGLDCASQGFVFGALTCASDCTLDSSGCASETILDFEAGLIPAGFTGGGNGQWSVGTGTPYEGSYRARSGDISHSQETWAQVTVEFPIAGTVSFFQRISSESGYDYGIFTIDGSEQGSWSGNGAWVQQSYPVSAGQHTLRWTYDKDSSFDSYDDAWYVDYIVLSNGYIP